jgi:retron-type reverse transcriptase
MGLERRGCVVRPWSLANWKREEPVDEAKPFKIPKREVWEAFKRVKANQGAAGVDGQSIAEFEANLSGNLYKLWNRVSSGSYFPLFRAAAPWRSANEHRFSKETRRHGRHLVRDS